MQTLDYIVVIPAYNEESRIAASLKALKNASEATDHRLVQVIIALNGCTDATEAVIRRTNKQLQLPLTLLHSERGYVTAMNTLFSHAKLYYPDTTIVKTDADSMVCRSALGILLDQLVRSPKLIIVGGHSMPIFDKPHNLQSAVRHLKARILSLRSVYPLSQVSTHDTSNYHEICRTDPQPNILDKEVRLKTFFHGRLWCARTSSHIANLDDSVIGDDVFLTVWTYKNYGPNTIRVRYDANALYHPYSGLRRHWKVYKRIHEDKRRVMMLPAYSDLQQTQQVRLDWLYILLHVPIKDKVLFMIYGIIVGFENTSFNMVRYRDSFWQYQEKEA